MPNYRVELVEKYLARPADHPDLYRERSPITHVENLAAPLLIVHGIDDSRVPICQAHRFRDELRKRPAPELSCPECPNDAVLVGEKSADGAKVQRWFDCPDCGYEAPSPIVYGAER